MNRIGSGSASPGPTVIGNDDTCGARKSAELDAIAVIDSAHLPLFVTISGSSANAPTHTSPKLPAFAMIRFALGAARTPETGTAWGPPGALLTIVITPAFGPSGGVGWKRMTTSSESPGPTSRG